MRALDAQRHISDDGAEQAGGEPRGEQRRNGGNAVFHGEDRGRIGADAEERRVPEAEFSEIAYDDVEAEREQRVEHPQHEQVMEIAALRQQRQYEENPDRREQRCARERHREWPASPNNPCGRHSNTTMMIP